MTRWLRFREWSIAARLLSVTVVPVAVLFVSVAAWIYVSGRLAAIQAVHRNGELLAVALAQTSQFAVLSANADTLGRSVQRMLATRADVSAIEILDERRRRIAYSGRSHGVQTFAFEQPISDDAPDVDLFVGNAPHAVSPGVTTVPLRPVRVIGYVRVLMSPAPVLKQERDRLLLAGLVLLIAAGFCVPLGVYLARRSIRMPLGELTRALQAVKSGMFEIRLLKTTGGEIGEMQNAFEEMAAALAVATHMMRQEVDRRTEELALTLKRLQASDEERRRLMAHTNDLVEEDRRRIARELHDQFNASLLTIRQRAASLLRDVSQPDSTPDGQEVKETATFIIEAAERLYDDARVMLKRLRPEALDTLGLAGAIKAAVRTCNESQDTCRIELDAATEGLPQLPGRVSIAAYRVVQEALTNILKHSHAKHGKVFYRFDADTRRLSFTVTDDGIGFDVSRRYAGFGILGMRERVDAASGCLDILSASGHGAVVKFSLPVGCTEAGTFRQGG